MNFFLFYLNLKMCKKENELICIKQKEIKDDYFHLIVFLFLLFFVLSTIDLVGVECWRGWFNTNWVPSKWKKISESAFKMLNYWTLKIRTFLFLFRVLNIWLAKFIELGFDFITKLFIRGYQFVCVVLLLKTKSSYCKKKENKALIYLLTIFTR